MSDVEGLPEGYTFTPQTNLAFDPDMQAAFANSALIVIIQTDGATAFAGHPGFPPGLAGLFLADVTAEMVRANPASPEEHAFFDEVAKRGRRHGWRNRT